MFSNSQILQKVSPEADSSAYWPDFDAWLVHLATRPGATLLSVCSQARGAFPSTAAERLLLHNIGLEAGAATTPESPVPEGPELHAAEFEWYFTEACAADLARFLSPSQGRALVMGGPTVAAKMRAAGHMPTTVDRSPFLKERFGSVIGEPHRHDLRFPLGFLRSYETVFFDAPWHEDHISRWLWQATLAVRPGGTIAFALFGEWTRPAARVERMRLLELASTIGKVNIFEDALHYDTPLFEAEALAAAGAEIRLPWRRGDLVLIEDARATIAAPSVPAERTWGTVLSGTRVIKLHPGQVFPVEPGNSKPLRTLDTVSRSRIRAAAIGVWTSRNEIAPIKRKYSQSQDRARAF